jgi:hypothetical protein
LRLGRILTVITSRLLDGRRAPLLFRPSYTATAGRGVELLSVYTARPDGVAGFPATDFIAIQDADSNEPAIDSRQGERFDSPHDEDKDDGSHNAEQNPCHCFDRWSRAEPPEYQRQTLA